LGGDIYVSALDGANVHRVTFDNRDIMGFCWTKDGKGLIVSSRRGDGVPRLWQLSINGKEEHPLTEGLTLPAFPSMSPKGDQMILTTYRTFNTIWEVVNGVATKLISEQGSNSTPQLSPDGKALVYRSERSGAFELWVSKLDGSEGARITNFGGTMDNNPRWSPDGTQIAFECRPHGNSQICLVNAFQPTQPRVLNQWASNEIYPSWSADGKSIYFASNYSGRWEIYKENIAEGDPVAITHDGGMRAIESPDGRWLYIFRTEEGDQIVRLSLPTDPNAEHRVIAFGPPDSDMLGRWDTTDNGIVCLMSPSVKSAESFDKENLVAINGENGVRHDIGSVAGPLPGGDLVFSTARNGSSFLYVKRELQQADLSFLVLGPKHGS
jgi:Tol biopolymer transport system component